MVRKPDSSDPTPVPREVKHTKAAARLRAAADLLELGYETDAWLEMDEAEEWLKMRTEK